MEGNGRTGSSCRSRFLIGFILLRLLFLSFCRCTIIPRHFAVMLRCCGCSISIRTCCRLLLRPVLQTHIFIFLRRGLQSGGFRIIDLNFNMKSCLVFKNLLKSPGKLVLSCPVHGVVLTCHRQHRTVHLRLTSVKNIEVKDIILLQDLHNTILILLPEILRTILF